MSENGAVKVAIVEDHVALRTGLELLLGRHGCVVVGSADGVEEGFELIILRRPDVALVDINLPDGSGVELTRRLLELEPELGVLLYSGAEDSDTLRDALDCGARGFARKAGSPRALKDAIHAVAAGGSYVDSTLKSTILAQSTTERIGVLSPREREVLDLLARGRTGEQIAAELFLSPETVRTHVRNAMEKLEASTRVHAITIALRDGEIGF